MFCLHLECPSCSRKTRIDVASDSGEFVCSSCGKATLFPRVAGGEPRWFVTRRQKRVGPFSLCQLQQLALGHQFAPGDRVWHSGLIEWCDALSLPEIQQMLRSDSTQMIAGLATLKDADAVFLDEATDDDEQTKYFAGGPSSRPELTLDLSDFQILRKLGSGGMGAVYLAEQRSQNRRVALKVLGEHFLSNRRIVDRFLREAQALATLNHPNIVHFLGAGEQNGLPFFAMEFVEGFSTAALLRFLGRFKVADALHLVGKCAQALSYAHGRHVIHRDIKPENILVTRLGHVKIADLGLAKNTEVDLGQTESGVTLGTPRYMSPEQYRNAKHADHRSDIYALGGVLYFFLTGELPFREATAMELMLSKERGLFKKARALNPEISPRLELLIDKMLARDPKHRYQNYDDLMRDLRAVAPCSEHLSFNPIHVVPPEPEAPSYDLVQVLVIDDDFVNIFLAQRTLEENDILSNLHVAPDCDAAFAFLRRQAPFAAAPPPDLIVFGLPLSAPRAIDLLRELQNHECLSKVPLIVVATAPDTRGHLEKQGFAVSLTVNEPRDLVQYDNAIKSVRGMFLTVVERIGFPTSGPAPLGR